MMREHSMLIVLHEPVSEALPGIDTYIGSLRVK
jgi:hypothetical protein